MPVKDKIVKKTSAGRLSGIGTEYLLLHRTVRFFRESVRGQVFLHAEKYIETEGAWQQAYGYYYINRTSKIFCTNGIYRASRGFVPYSSLGHDHNIASQDT